MWCSGSTLDSAMINAIVSVVAVTQTRTEGVRAHDCKVAIARVGHGPTEDNSAHDSAPAPPVLIKRG
jgi:hypothetical protein